MDRIQRAASYVEIVEMLARYAEIIDRREWASLSEIFSEDGTFDATSIGYDFLDGVAHIQQHMASSARHPVAHLILNVTAEIEDDRADVTSRLMGLQPDGRVFVGEYQDHMIRVADGWRIRTRIYSRLSEPSDPTFPESLPGR
jgi:hypothetical protein